MRLLLLLVSLLMISACGSVSTTGSPSNPIDGSEQGAPPVLTGDFDQLLELVNEARSKTRSCGGETFQATTALTANSILMLTADKHSQDMQAANKMSHDTKAGAIHYKVGSQVWDRATEEGYNWRKIGENVAFGFSAPESVTEAWLESSGHCKNIMNPDFKEIGLGKAGTYWTQVFGTSR